MIEEHPAPRDVQNTLQTPSLIDELLNEPVGDEPLPLFNPNSSRTSEFTMNPIDTLVPEPGATHEPADEFEPTETDSPVRHTSVEEWTLQEEFGDPETSSQTDTTEPILPDPEEHETFTEASEPLVTEPILPKNAEPIAPAVTEFKPEPELKPQNAEDSLPEAVQPITPPDDAFAPAVREPEPELKPQNAEDSLPEAVQPITPPDDAFAPAVREPEPELKPQNAEDSLPEAVQPITPPDDAFAPAVRVSEQEPVKATASATSQARETEKTTPPEKTIDIGASMLSVEDVTLTPATIDDGEKN